jgi:peroxiredoxin
MANLPHRQSPIAVGDAAPDFTLKDQNKAEWNLKANLAKGPVALCFYPMDFSPVCSAEMKCVTDDMDQWKAKGVQVVGVSCDSFFVHEAWAKSLGLKQTLLADMHREVCKAYGFYWADLNISGRGTVLVGKDGKVQWVQKREIPQAMKSDDLTAALAM